MSQAITGRWNGKRRNGRVCTITEVTEYDHLGPSGGPVRGTYVLVDQEPTERLAKGQYQILPGKELVTCDDPEAP